MRMISNRVMKSLNGEIRILDMHFDTNSLANLMQLVDRYTQQYSKICVSNKFNEAWIGVLENLW